MLDFLSALVIVLLIAILFVFLLLKERKRSESLITTYEGRIREIMEEYDSKLRLLKDEQFKAIEVAKKKSVSSSRATIKGRISEQLAPMLPEFKYFPSDAKFVGDPIDYIVFDGYTKLKDSNEEVLLEIILLDIKSGKSSLSKNQRKIAEAVNSGRVRFEVVRINPDGSTKVEDFSAKSSSESCNRYGDGKSFTPSMLPENPATYSVQKIREKHSNAYEPWSEDDVLLSKRFREGATVQELVVEFQRQPGGIRSRLKKLGLKR